MSEKIGRRPRGTCAGPLIPYVKQRYGGNNDVKTSIAAPNTSKHRDRSALGFVSSFDCIEAFRVIGIPEPKSEDKVVVDNVVPDEQRAEIVISSSKIEISRTETITHALWECAEGCCEMLGE